MSIFLVAVTSYVAPPPLEASFWKLQLLWRPSYKRHSEPWESRNERPTTETFTPLHQHPPLARASSSSGSTPLNERPAISPTKSPFRQLAFWDIESTWTLRCSRCPCFRLVGNNLRTMHRTAPQRFTGGWNDLTTRGVNQVYKFPDGIEELRKRQRQTTGMTSSHKGRLKQIARASTPIQTWELYAPAETRNIRTPIRAVSCKRTGAGTAQRQACPNSGAVCSPIEAPFSGCFPLAFGHFITSATSFPSA